ncbi:multicopper oxidase MmcO [Mycobacterium kiyosense]|uniref:multicopper oxidase family protein n=1 Tax=Mycobacterium kiyosense TaxID=2871094 RepID=UPI00216EC9A8|nr:multicopper oxidase family protein [Mycobacterium kiyosense]GLD27238.1 multicopper oxidase MmcO [Mycobacterium kiyosense]
MGNEIPLNRRRFVAASIAGAAGLALGACWRSDPASNLQRAIAATEKARPHTGRTVTTTLTAQPASVDLGGPVARTLAYGDALPGPLIRANVGDELAVTVRNRLGDATSVHWHGIALRNDMDGVLPSTPDIGANSDFTYRFSSPHPGTYWAHPHVGLQTDYGLYLPVIIDDPADPGRYDAEWIVVLDDWTDGVGQNPQQIFDELKGSRMQVQGPGQHEMPGMSAVGSAALLGGDSGDIAYPYYLVNGRVAAAPTTFDAKPGQRIRIRIINAGADTTFRVALAGHVLTVTHTDGFPVVPTDADALLVGMAERYDVIVTAGDGVFPLVAMPEGKTATPGRALLKTANGSPPDVNFRPPELDGRIGTVDTFTAPPSASLGSVQSDANLALELTGSMAKYDWAINGKPYPDSTPVTVKQGQRATLAFTNSTMMYHPMHLHGHTFQVIKADGSLGARKDTVIVLPNQKLNAVLIADNPGTWMIHCHHGYHLETGMMTTLNYTSYST